MSRNGVWILNTPVGTSVRGNKWIMRHITAVWSITPSALPAYYTRPTPAYLHTRSDVPVLIYICKHTSKCHTRHPTYLHTTPDLLIHVCKILHIRHTVLQQTSFVPASTLVVILYSIFAYFLDLSLHTTADILVICILDQTPS
jgi:hypothetical protein